MEESKNKIDGLEVFVKVKMGCNLTPEELEVYNCYDETEKSVIFDFINNPSFINELSRIVKKIQNSEAEKDTQSIK